MTNEEALKAWKKFYAEIDKENGLFVGTINPEMVSLTIKALEDRPQGEWIEGENGTIKCDQCGCEIRYSYLIGNKPDFPKFCCDWEHI